MQNYNGSLDSTFTVPYRVWRPAHRASSVGDSVVDFILVLIELISLGVMAVSL